MTCTPGPTKAMLVEAEKAYHELVLGRSVVEITDQNGEKVRFTSAKRTDLYLYIQQLRAQLCPAETTALRPNGPAGFLF